jgi:hypothetical protein
MKAGLFILLQSEAKYDLLIGSGDGSCIPVGKPPGPIHSTTFIMKK